MREIGSYVNVGLDPGVCYPPPENFRWWAHRWKVTADQSKVIIINGHVRSGKSTLVLRAIQQEFPEVTVATLDEHVAFNVRDLLAKALRLRDTVLWVDEAIVGGQAMDYNSPEGRALTEHFNTGAWMHQTIYSCIPSVVDFLKSVRERVAGYFVEVGWNQDLDLPTGQATVRTRNWDLRKPLRRGDLGVKTDWARNPITWEKFAEMDPLWVEYQRLKRMNDEARARWQILQLDSSQSWQTVTIGQAAQFLGVSATTVQSLLDKGRLEYQQTPGGQRRVLAQSLHQLLNDTVRAPHKKTQKTKKTKPHGESGAPPAEG